MPRKSLQNDKVVMEVPTSSLQHEREAKVERCWLKGDMFRTLSAAREIAYCGLNYGDHPRHATTHSALGLRRASLRGAPAFRPPPPPRPAPPPPPRRPPRKWGPVRLSPRAPFWPGRPDRDCSEFSAGWGMEGRKCCELKSLSVYRGS